MYTLRQHWALASYSVGIAAVLWTIGFALQAMVAAGLGGYRPSTPVAWQLPLMPLATYALLAGMWVGTVVITRLSLDPSIKAFSRVTVKKLWVASNLARIVMTLIALFGTIRELGHLCAGLDLAFVAVDTPSTFAVIEVVFCAMGIGGLTFATWLFLEQLVADVRWLVSENHTSQDLFSPISTPASGVTDP